MKKQNLLTRALLLMLALSMLLSFAACGNKPAEPSPSPTASAPVQSAEPVTHEPSTQELINILQEQPEVPWPRR